MPGARPLVTCLFLASSLLLSDFAFAGHTVIPAGKVSSYVNARKSPASGAEKVGVLRLGGRATVLETLPDWQKSLYEKAKMIWAPLVDAGDPRAQFGLVHLILQWSRGPAGR